MFNFRLAPSQDRPLIKASARGESGQVVVLSALVLALFLAACVALALVGAAMVDRTSATIAADAVALADAVDPAAADSLAGWYEDRGLDVTTSSGRARAEAADAQARSRAVADDELRVAPVIRAVVARAEQLLGRSLTVVSADGVTVTFSPTSASRFGSVAAELGMCSLAADTFTRC